MLNQNQFQNRGLGLEHWQGSSLILYPRLSIAKTIEIKEALKSKWPYAVFNYASNRFDTLVTSIFLLLF